MCTIYSINTRIHTFCEELRFYAIPFIASILLVPFEFCADDLCDTTNGGANAAGEFLTALQTEFVHSDVFIYTTQALSLC